MHRFSRICCRFVFIQSFSRSILTIFLWNFLKRSRVKFFFFHFQIFSHIRVWADQLMVGRLCLSRPVGINMNLGVGGKEVLRKALLAVDIVQNILTTARYQSINNHNGFLKFIRGYLIHQRLFGPFGPLVHFVPWASVSCIELTGLKRTAKDFYLHIACHTGCSIHFRQVRLL